MNKPVEFCLNKATEAEIADHLFRCDADFVPSLRGRVEISSYAHKIADKATRFEAWAEGVLVGLVAVYCNDSECHVAYITSVSVLQEWKGRGIASTLMEQCIRHAKGPGYERIELEVDSENAAAIKLYEKKGFMVIRVSDQAAIMRFDIGKDA